MENSAQQHGPRFGVFHISCWVLALVAFIQVMSVGVALALRPKTTVVEHVVTKYVSMPPPAAVTAVPPKASSSQASRPKPEPKIDLSTVPDLPFEASTIATAPQRVLQSAPIIADPVAERRVQEAREARIRSDHQAAVIKLDQALILEPDHPAIFYEMAANFEAMGIYDKATDQYLKVFRLGPVKGGSLWKKAAAKIERGIVPDVKGIASLGVARLSTPQETPQGERRAVVLPVVVPPSQEFDSSLLETKVHFFEKQKGEVKQVSEPENQGFAWLSEPVDWMDGEELVEVWYHIPPSDIQQRHLFGKREFYGYVAELYYAGKSVDVRAHPRTLINEMRKRSDVQDDYGWDPHIDPVLESLQDFEPGDSLLPKWPQKR